MRVRFWGVRGSVPWSEPGSMAHGCNTACIEVTDEASGHGLVLDAGTGLIGVSGTLEEPPRAMPILLTHYHWDHVQGLPFFDPFYERGWSPGIWAPRLAGVDPTWIRTVFESPFWPMTYDQLPSRPEVTLFDPGTIEIGGFRVEALLIHHPGGAFAYRIHGATGDLVYATDYEFGQPHVDAAFGTFARGAAALVIDAHFTPEELPRYAGWGHASWAQGTRFAAANGIGALWLFHHRPGRSDAEITAIETAAQGVFARTTAAREGCEFRI